MRCATSQRRLPPSFSGRLAIAPQERHRVRLRGRHDLDVGHRVDVAFDRGRGRGGRGRRLSLRFTERHQDQTQHEDPKQRCHGVTPLRMLPQTARADWRFRANSARSASAFFLMTGCPNSPILPRTARSVSICRRVSALGRRQRETHPRADPAAQPPVVGLGAHARLPGVAVLLLDGDRALEREADGADLDLAGCPRRRRRPRPRRSRPPERSGHPGDVHQEVPQALARYRDQALLRKITSVGGPEMAPHTPQRVRRFNPSNIAPCVSS